MDRLLSARHSRAGGNPDFRIPLSLFDTIHYMKESYVYILASKRNGTLYIGVTTNLEKRIQQHKQGVYKGFSKKYNVYILVYYEVYFNIRTAIEREKCIKKWNRVWKLRLIEKNNPTWSDLYPGFPPARE